MTAAYGAQTGRAAADAQLFHAVAASLPEWAAAHPALLNVTIGKVTKPPTTTVTPGATTTEAAPDAVPTMPPFIALTAFIYAGGMP